MTDWRPIATAPKDGTEVLLSEDSEDGGEELRKLLDAGKRLVCKHPAKQIKNFTYGMRSHCPDCGHSEESWWD